jgi:hypothetical protein
MKTLNPGVNTFNIDVTAEDGSTTVTYTVTVRRASSDATLSSLTVSAGTLSPSFSSGTTNYTVNVGSGTGSITLTATANHAGATVSGDGTKTINTGDNTFNITVTAEDGLTTGTYTVTVRRASSDATLSSLTVSAGTLSPAFNSGIAGYTVNVGNGTGSIILTATANHAGATVSGDGTKTLNTGDNTFNIVVTAEDGLTTGTYTVTVRRTSSDAALSSLTASAGTLSPSFSSGTTNYTVNVGSGVSSIILTATANHAGATVTGDGTKTLNTGDNTFRIDVTAEDGSTVMSYRVTVTRDDHVLNTEANLQSLKVNGKTLQANGLVYAAGCGESSVRIDNVEASEYAGITLNGVTYSGGVTVNLTGDITNVNIRVTAETGGAMNDYTLKIAAPVEESLLYYQRWDNVLSINRNPANNGNIDVSGVRWFGRNGTSLGNSDYIMIQGAPEDYYAEIKTGGEWHRACRTGGGRSIEKVVAYPNPVSRGESLTLQLPEAFAGGTASIYGIGGPLVKSKIPVPAKSNSVNVSDLDSGIYLIRITGKNGNTETVKIIIE